MFKFSNDYLWTKITSCKNNLLNFLFWLTKIKLISISQFTPFQVATFKTICRYSSFYVTWKTIPNARLHKWSPNEFTVWFWDVELYRSRGSSISAVKRICYMILKVVRTYVVVNFIHSYSKRRKATCGIFTEESILNYDYTYYTYL